jgi:hypothetical protein
MDELGLTFKNKNIQNGLRKNKSNEFKGTSRSIIKMLLLTLRKAGKGQETSSSSFPLIFSPVWHGTTGTSET